MDILQTFVLDNTSHNVNIIFNDNKPLFQANQIAKILDIKQIHNSIANFDSDEKVTRKTVTLGGEQNMVFLTKHGVYRLLMRSNKPVARPFQKWLMNVIDNIEEQGKYELRSEIEKKIKHEKDLEIEQIKDEYKALSYIYEKENNIKYHQLLIDSFANKKIVYIAQIKEMPDGKYLIKIGSTFDIKTRSRGLKSRFDCEIMFLKVFESDNYENFEKFLLNHYDIKKLAFNDNSVFGINNGKECFLMDKKEIEKLLNIASRNLSQFTNNIKEKINTRSKINDIALQVGKIQKLLENQEKITIADQPINLLINSNINNEQSKETNKEITVINEIISTNNDERKEDNVEYPNKRGICTITGSKIQKYSSDGQQLLQTYNSCIEVLRDINMTECSRRGLFNAIEANTIYRGYRFEFLDRDLPDDTFQVLEPSVEVKVIKSGFVVKLNKDKSKILDLYDNQKQASEANGYSSAGFMSSLISKQKMTVHETFYMHWDDCSNVLKEEYLRNNELPVQTKPNGFSIQKLDPRTNEVLETFPSLAVVCTKYKISRKTLYAAINGDLIKRDYKWKFA